MKKVVALLLALIICSMTIASCNVQEQTTTTPPIVTEPPEHVHTPGAWVTIKEPTCQDGEQCQFCASCGEVIQTEPIKATGVHKEVVDHAIEATCTSIGLTEGKHCIECGEVLVNQNIVPFKAHNVEIIPAVQSTCVETGLTEGNKCSECGQILVAQQEAPLKPHTYDDKYDEICNECGFIRDAECAHIETTTLNGYESTCTSTGLTNGSKCNKCGEILVAQEIIFVKAHTEVIDSAVPATCTSTGLTEGKHCSVCNTVIVAQETTSTISHIESDWIVDLEATKTEDGKKHTICTMCGKTMAEKTIAAIGSIGLEYSVNADGKTCTITGIGTCTDSHVVIPTTIDGYKATAIANRAFYECTTMTEITIPASVTSIGTQIFYKASNLTTVYYNSTYSSKENEFLNLSHITKVVLGGAFIPSYVLYQCAYVETVVISSNVTSIGDYAFCDCTSLTSIEIPDSVKYIGRSAFAGCESLTSIEIPNSVTSISKYAFAVCKSLTSIEIPDSVTEIYDYTFNSCNSLTSVVIGDSVRSIGEYAFYNCTSLTSIGPVGSGASIEIPNSVTSIGRHAFDNCTSLTSVVIPDTITIIPPGAFYNCSSLTSVVIPDSITNIREYAFSGCSSLTSIVIPDSVTNIAYDAFRYSSSLTIYCVAESQHIGWHENWNSSNRPVVWGYTGE